MNTEFEAKFLISSSDGFRKHLQSLSAHLVFNKRLFKRKIFTSTLLEQNQWVRVRDEHDKVMLCTKKNIGTGDIHTVQEYETEVVDFDETCLFLSQVGFEQTLYCENYRELWEYKNCSISIDHWPALDPYVEIEGANEREVHDVVVALGFNMKEGVFGSSFDVYHKHYGISQKDFQKITTLTFDTIFPDFFKKN